MANHKNGERDATGEESGNDVPDGYLEGKDLEPHKLPPPDRCWWCGADGPLTSEHKFKKADLTRMWSGELSLLWGSAGKTRLVASAKKSKEVRFQRSMCAACNGARSQPFDRAYDTFAEYLWENQQQLWRRRQLRMTEIFGKDWREKTLQLSRYFAKHIACRMRDDGFKVPDVIVPFLNGGQLLPNVQMVLFKDRSLYNLLRAGWKEGADLRGLYISPALGSVSKSRQRLTQYSSSLAIGHVGVFYRWDEDYPQTDPFYLYPRASLHLRQKLPTQ